jgi:probable F420-dependent oxidoreductase
MSVQHPFRFGVVAPQLGSSEAWAAKARRIEALGYATLLIPDVVGDIVTPMPALAFAAAATQTLRVGPYVLANDLRNPVMLAREVAAIDLLSGGRFELGIGAGRPHADEDYAKLGIGLDPGGVRVDRLAESIGIVKALLAGERVTVDGHHYTLTGADVFPQPAQRPRPPLLVAAAGRRMLALAAREADIIAVADRPDAPETTVRAKIDWLREAVGSRFDRIEINLNLVAVGQEMHPQMLAWIGLTPDQLRGSTSPFLLLGTIDQMCAGLLERRETLGASYITVPEAFLETFSPVVERLAGR